MEMTIRDQGGKLVNETVAKRLKTLTKRQRRAQQRSWAKNRPTRSESGSTTWSRSAQTSKP